MVLAAVAATALAILRPEEPRPGAEPPIGGGGGGGCCCVCGEVSGCCGAEV